MTRYLKLALLGVTLVAIGLIVLNLRTQAQAANLRPLVIRIDEVGRAQAVDYGTLTYAPQSTELKYFLIQFTQLHCGRMRATVRDNVGKSRSSSTRVRRCHDGRVAEVRRDRSVPHRNAG
jgi:type IV secretion system protein VirB5